MSLCQHGRALGLSPATQQLQGDPIYKNLEIRPKSLGVMCGPPPFGELRVLTRGTRFTFFGAPRVLPTTNPTSKIVGSCSTADPSARTHIQQPTSSLGSQPVAALHTVSHAGGPLHQVCFVHSLKSAFIRQVLAVRKLFLMRFPLNLTSRFLIWPAVRAQNGP